MSKESMLLFVNENNLMSAVPLKIIEDQWKNNKLVKIEGDKKSKMFVVHEDSQLFIFTNDGKVYSINSYELVKNYPLPSQEEHCHIELLSWKNFLLKGMTEENGQSYTRKIVSVISDNDLMHSEKFQLFLVTEKGICKKIESKHLKNTDRAEKIIIQLRAGDQLKKVQKIDNQSEIILISEEGRAVRFSSSDVRSMGRNSMGVRGINLRVKGTDNKMVWATSSLEGNKLLIIGDKGFGKILDLQQLALVKRGNKKGMICHKLTTGGWIIYASCVREDDYLIGWTYRNNLHKISVKTIQQIDSRYSRGGLVLKESQKVYDSLIGIVKYIN